MVSDIKGLFINNKKAKDSIYESGLMVFNCLALSNKFTLDYVEIDINNRTIPTTYNFYFFNYHPVTMGWLNTKYLKNLGFSITMILEVLPNDPFVMCPPKHFHAYCVLDPTIKSKKNVYAFPRPLEKVNFELVKIENEIPVIGTFGFATKGKGFHHVVEAVNKEFDNAIIKVNIPFGDFIPDSNRYAEYLGTICKQRAKPGITVKVSHDFMSKTELVQWCSANTLNCFLYDRNMPGLSATTDQAIISGSPLSVSDNETFRHITAYLPPYPKWSLRDSIEKSEPLINEMQKDWSPENFARKFETVLGENELLINKGDHFEQSNFTLPVKSKTVIDPITRRIKKYKRKIKKFNLKSILNFNDPKRSKKII